MFRITFNGEQISRALREAMGRLDDMTRVFLRIGEEMVLSTQTRFAEGRAPDGSAWAPKSETTLKRYAWAGERVDIRPLFGPSGRLYSEIAYFAGRDQVEFGSNMIYSGVMQRGAGKGAFGADSKGRPIPWGNIPARVWLGLSDQDERTILDIVDEHLDDPFE